MSKVVKSINFQKIGAPSKQQEKDEIELSNQENNNHVMKPLIDYNQLANFLMQSVPTREEAVQIVRGFAAQQDIQSDPISIIFKIDEVLRPFDEENLRAFSDIPQKSNVIAFQSSYDGKFCVVWKFEEICTLNVLDDLSCDDLQALCKFIVKFLSRCMKENHSGLPTKKSKSSLQHNLNLRFLTDSNGLNLFLYAAHVGNTRIVKILLENFFAIDSAHNNRIAADFAYEARHFGTLLELLRANSKLPRNLTPDDCPDEVRELLRSREPRAPDEKEDDSSFWWTALLYAIVVLPLLAFFIFMFVYDPTLLWRDLDDEQRQLVLNGTVRFAGVDMRFRDLFRENDSSVFEALTYEQILVLMRDKVLDLGKHQHIFLQEDIYLTYANMSDDLREKVRNSTVGFQGAEVPLEWLIGDETDIYDALGTNETFWLISDKSSLSIGSDSLTLEDTQPLQYRNFNIFNEETKNSQILSYDELLDEDSDRKLILINNGMSARVRNFAATLKNAYSSKWVEYVDLKDQTDALKLAQRAHDIDDILATVLGIDEEFELKVLQKFIKDRNLVIFWDGFDEIPLDYVDFLFSLMLRIKDETQNVQFVATHPQYEDYIGRKFYHKVFKLFLK